MAGVSVEERALAFECEGERLVGVAAVPAQPGDIGVVILVGGPQYRVGSHRQFLLLSRRLAAAGVAALRFDYRGMGDSTGMRPPFDETTPDIEAAIAALQTASPSVRRIVLWGLCDAASSALLYPHARHDPRIAGMVMLNPWIRSEDTLAKTYVKHYYGRRLLDAGFWKKLASGKVDLRASTLSVAAGVRALAAQGRGGGSKAAAFQDRMAESLEQLAAPVLIVLSERDLMAKEFTDFVRSNPRWARALSGSRVEQVQVAQADHTFSTAAWRSEVEERMLDWMRRRALLAPG